jgi:hypothetical protein
MSDDDFTRAINWVAENLHADKGRYTTHPIQAVRDRIDEIRAERGLPSFSTRVSSRHREFDMAAWLNGKRAQPSRMPAPAVPVAAAGTNPAYVKAALDRELNELAEATEGHRNDTLHAVACNVFEFVKAGHVEQAAAVAELERIASAIGLTDSEIRDTLRSAWNKVAPRAVPAPTGLSAYTLEGPTL